MKREYFTFYASWYDAISELDDESRCLLYDSIMQYALFHIEPELTGVANMVWKIIRPILESSWKKYKNGCKGGCPKGIEKPTMRGNQNARRESGNKTETKPKQNQNESNKQITNNKKQRTNNKMTNTISDEPILSAKTSFAPGGCADNETCEKVVVLYNSIFKKKKVYLDEINDMRRKQIMYVVGYLSNDMSKVESVFRDIANAPTLPIRNPSFADIIGHPAFAEYWSKYAGA